MHGTGPLGRPVVLACYWVSVFLGVIILTTPGKRAEPPLPRRSQLPVTLGLSVVLAGVMVAAVFREHRSATRAAHAEQARQNDEARRLREERRSTDRT